MKQNQIKTNERTLIDVIQLGALDAVFLESFGIDSRDRIEDDIYHLKHVIEMIDKSEANGSKALSNALKKRLLDKINLAKEICKACDIKPIGETKELIKLMESKIDSNNI